MSVRLRPGVLVASVACLLISAAPVAQRIPGVGRFVVPRASAPGCTGSGQTWTCGAGSTIANVDSAIASATDGATITFAAGNYTWTVGTIDLSNTKGVTLICAAQWECDVTQGTNTMIELVFSGTNTKFYRISGFDFNGTGVCGTCMWFWGNGTLSQFRIDHNRWTGYNTSLSDAAALLFLGSISTYGQCAGVIDNNVVDTVASNMIVKNWCGYNDDYAIMNPAAFGTSQNVFVEDNTFTLDLGDNAVACVDAAVNNSTVVRFNTTTNCRGFDSHGMPHQGANNYELYLNDMTKNEGSSMINGFRLFLHQGAGTMFIWGNRATVSGTISATALNFIHYRDSDDQTGPHGICDGTQVVDGNTAPEATHRGYPCISQPGRKEAGGTPIWGKLAPLAAFLNRTSGGAKIDLVFSCPFSAPQYCTEHIQPNRDYYNAVSANAQSSSSSPFDGTTGIGHGTLANRPTTCTHTTSPDGDDGGGVMYFATDQGSWNSESTALHSTHVSASHSESADGVLYRCSATDTWSVYYTPYDYPHPLRTN